MTVEEMLKLVPDDIMVIIKTSNEELMAIAYSQTIRTDYRCDDFIKENVIEIIPINDCLKLVLEG